MDFSHVEENSQRVAINNKQDLDVKINIPMKRRTKIFIGITITLSVLAIVGLALGLYFHYKPSSTHIQTNVFTTNDGNLNLATRFVINKNNINDDPINQQFTIMFSTVDGNSSQNQRRLLTESDDYPTNVEIALHWVDNNTGIKMIFFNEQLQNITIPLEQVIDYFSQNDEIISRSLQQTQSLVYDNSTNTYTIEDIFDIYRQQINDDLKYLFGENQDQNVQIEDIQLYQLTYDFDSTSFINVDDNQTSSRRLLFLKGISHTIKSHVHHITHKISGVVHHVVHAVKKHGPTILRYGAKAALAGADIAAQGSAGFSQAKDIWKQKSIKKAAEIAGQGVAEGVASKMPAYISIPAAIAAKGCIAHPPAIHCTRKGLQGAAKSVLINAVKKKALSTALSLVR